MTRRVSALLVMLLSAVLLMPGIARAQYATPNTAGANGGSCTSGYAWPDSGGHALVCSGGTWQLVNDTIWSVSGSNIYFNGGNVGIGTTSLAYGLVVAGGDSASLITSQNSSMTGSPTFQFGMNNGNNAGLIQATAGKDIKVYNGQYALTILGSNGDVGIGTTSPGAPLQVYSGQALEGISLRSGAGGGYTAYSLGRTGVEAYLGVANTAGNWFTGSVAGDIGLVTASKNLALSTSNGAAPAVYINTSGNVGIGTNAPLTILDVRPTSNGRLLVSANNDITTPTIWISAVNDANTLEQAIEFAASKYGFLNGNVGINTTSPVGLLSVNLASASGSTGAWDNTYAMFGAAGSTTGSAVGIGYNSSSDFGEIRSAAPGTSWKDLYIRGKNLLFFYQNGGGVTTEGMRIVSSTGSVGIGATSPSSTLDVHGSHSTAALNSSTGSIATFTSDTTVQLQFGAITGGSYAAWIQSKVDGQNTAYPIDLQPAGGNVGIGTTAPAANGLTINSVTPTLTFELSGTSEESLYDDGSYFYVMSTSGGNGAKLQHGATLWTSSSDRRIKKDIAALPESYGLSAVERLKPVTFHWRDPKSPQQLQMGLIAQDVQQVIPELVTRSGPTRYAPDGELGIEYSGLVIPLIKAVQELKGDNDNLRHEFEAYKAAHP